VRTKTRRVFGLVLTACCLSACTQAIEGDPVADPRAKESAEPTGPVRLTILTPVDAGFEGLLNEYRSEHQNVSVVVQQAEPGAYYPKLQTMLAAGEAPDIVVIGEEYRAEYFNQPDLFADLEEVGPDDVDPERWLDWKYKGGFANDDRLVGYGLDSAPYGMAYRTDLFAAAGLPTDPAQVGDLFKTWDAYFAAGDQYVQKTGKPWFASSAEVFTAMQNQLETAYYDENDELVIDSNADIRTAWNAVTGAASRGQSAKVEPFQPDWFTAFGAGVFATAPAPYWMLALIESSAGAANAGKWAVADAFPGGAANWGGNYLSVPATSQNPEQAADLAAWLTAPEQQARVFQETKSFPSQIDALTSPEVTGATNDYFVTKETGKLYGEQARKIKVAPYAAPRDSRVQNEAMWPALAAVEKGTPPDAGWQQAVAGAKAVN
jgi:cellobiose transport system substrate-binding protein